MNSMSVKPQIIFPQDGHRDKPDCKYGKDQMASSRHCSVLYSIVNKPPAHEALHSYFCRTSFHFLYSCEDKWYHKLDAKIHIQNM